MKRLLGVLAFCLVGITPLFAQFDTAEVLGSVHDPSGAGVPKAALTLLNVDTASSRKRLLTIAETTRSRTSYRQIQSNGGSQWICDGGGVGCHRQRGARQRVDFSLKVGAVSGTIEVTGAATALKTD